MLPLSILNGEHPKSWLRHCLVPQSCIWPANYRHCRKSVVPSFAGCFYYFIQIKARFVKSSSKGKNKRRPLTYYQKYFLIFIKHKYFMQNKHFLRKNKEAQIKVIKSFWYFWLEVWWTIIVWIITGVAF